LSQPRPPDDPPPAAAELDAPTLAAIIRSSDDAIVTKTLEGVVMSWNHAAERMFGYGAREMVGRPVTVIFPPERLAEEDDFQRRIKAGGRIDHYETVRVRKDGARIDVSVTLSPIVAASGQLVGISKIARDITAQKAAQAQIRGHERLLQITLASIGDAVVTTDGSGRVTFMNPVAEALTGWPTGEAVERDFRDVMRLFWIQSFRRAFSNRAESAMPRADVAAEHKGRSPVGPALKNVWAPCFLTNRVQLQTFNQLEQMILVCRIAQTNTQPIRFWLTRFRVHNSKFARQVMMDLSFAKHSSIGVCNSASKGRRCAILRGIWKTSHR